MFKLTFTVIIHRFILWFDNLFKHLWTIWINSSFPILKNRNIGEPLELSRSTWISSHSLDRLNLKKLKNKELKIDLVHWIHTETGRKLVWNFICLKWAKLELGIGLVRFQKWMYKSFQQLSKSLRDNYSSLSAPLSEYCNV